MMPSKLPVRIGEPSYGGLFRSDTGGEQAFVLPGELVATEPLRILQPSGDRVEPACVHFGLCGGCQYQHIRYPAQVELKAGILEGLLSGAGLTRLPEIQTHSAAEWAYRNRIRLRVETAADGSFVAGYNRRNSNEFLAIRMCPIAAPLLWRAAEAILRTPFPQLLGSISEMELFCSGDETRMQLQFFLRKPIADAAAFSAFCEALLRAIPELAGAAAELDPALNRRVRRRWGGLAWGKAGLHYETAGRSYWVGRGAFFQGNRFLVDRLVGLVCEDLSGALAWDLFAGVGLFTLALAERFGRVVAVEAGDAAARDLRAASKGGAAFEAVQAPTLDFLRARELLRERPDVIVADPPRAGLGAEASAVLARLAVPRLVYVSCDPVTLARDLKILTPSVYRIEKLDMIDLFPQTFHLETVVHLSRR